MYEVSPSVNEAYMREARWIAIEHRAGGRSHPEPPGSSRDWATPTDRNFVIRFPEFVTYFRWEP